MNFDQRYTYNRKTDKLGGGGFGTVYKAYDNVEQTYVALKFFNRTDLHKYSLKAEIARAKKLSNDNLCKYFSLEEKSISNIHGEEESLEIAILEYIPGGAIDKYLQKHPQHRDRILKDVLRGLLYLHSKGIIHRDISPSNILVDDSGAQPVAKIIDFGISKEINGEHSVSSQLIGKPQYMAPEQYRPKVYGENEKIDTRVDLWSFGMVAYELLSGKRIAQQLNLNTDSSGWIEDLNQADIDVCLEKIAEPWRKVLQHCLVKHAAQRAKTADALLDILNGKTQPTDPVKQDTIVVTPEPPPPPPPPPPPELNWKKYLPIAAVVLALLVIVLIIWPPAPKPVSEVKPEKDTTALQIDSAKVRTDTIPNQKGSVQETQESKTGTILPKEQEPEHDEPPTEVVVKKEQEPKPVEPPARSKLAIEWVDIPGGTFTMGSPSNEADRDGNEKQHTITLDGFKISKYEVTFAQYDAFCEATNREKPSDEGWGRGNRPVIHVSWHDAKAFADYVGYALPTEAQWEYACRAGSTSPFNTGTCLSTNEANYNGNYPYATCNKGAYTRKTKPVGSYARNAWGLYDMHGNVSEWCADWYDDYPTTAQRNPQGPSSGSYRVYRGGHWVSDAQRCRSAYRYFTTPNTNYYFIGFRLVSPK
jgi:sulfatase modifying factor 1